MKEKYIRPVVANSDVMNNLALVPLVVTGFGVAAAVAVTRATKAMKAVPYVKLPNLIPFDVKR